MPASDDRTLTQKLLDLALDPGATEGERTAARAALFRLSAKPFRTKTPGILTREQILATPDRSDAESGGVRVNLRGMWVWLDPDDARAYEG